MPSDEDPGLGDDEDTDPEVLRPLPDHPPTEGAAELASIAGACSTFKDRLGDAADGFLRAMRVHDSLAPDARRDLLGRAAIEGRAVIAALTTFIEGLERKARGEP